MTFATPARVTTPPTVRPSALLLFFAAAVAGCGLGLAALAVLAPAPQATPLPPVEAASLTPGTVADMAPARQSWAALFGTPPVAAPVASAPPPQRSVEPAYDPADDFDDSAYVLRGLAMADGTTDSFALIETPEGVMMLRIGDLLPDGYTVEDITEEGVVIDLFGDPYLIGFSDDSTSVDADAYDGSMGSRYEGPSRSRAPAYEPDRDAPADDMSDDNDDGMDEPFFAPTPDERIRDRFGISR